MNLKKLILALSLCLVLVLSLFAFEEGFFSSFREEDLYGTWVTSVPASKQVELTLSQFGIAYDIPDDLQMTYEFCFRDDNTVTVCVERESAKEIVAVQTEALRVCLPEFLYSQYETGANMTREETDAMLAAEGLTMETFVELALSQIDFESQYSTEATSITQYYHIDNGILAYAAAIGDLESGNYDLTVIPHFSGNTLVLSEAFDGEGNPYGGNGIVQYPMTLTRK